MDFLVEGFKESKRLLLRNDATLFRQDEDLGSL